MGEKLANEKTSMSSVQKYDDQRQCIADKTNLGRRSFQIL